MSCKVISGFRRKSGTYKDGFGVGVILTILHIYMGKSPPKGISMNYLKIISHLAKCLDEKEKEIEGYKKSLSKKDKDLLKKEDTLASINDAIKQGVLVWKEEI